MRSIISEVESGLEQLQGAGEMMESVGESRSAAYTLAGGTLAGGLISDKIAKKTSKYLKDKLKDNPNILYLSVLYPGIIPHHYIFEDSPVLPISLPHSGILNLQDL